MTFDVNILNIIFRYAVVIHTINTDTETHMGMFANIVNSRPPLCTTYDVRSVRTRTGIELYTSAMFSIFSETPCNAFVICANVHSLYGRRRYDTQPYTTHHVNVCVGASICWHSDVLPPIGHSYHFEQIKEHKKTETNLWNFSSLLPSNEPCIVFRFSIMCSCVCVIYSNSDEKPHNSLSGSWRVFVKKCKFHIKRIEYLFFAETKRLFSNLVSSRRNKNTKIYQHKDPIYSVVQLLPIRHTNMKHCVLYKDTL